VTAPLDVSGLLRRLADAGIDYVLIGGLAVNAHGVIRSTKDVDNVPSADRANLSRLAHLLSELFGIRLQVCSLAHLRQVKQTAGRPQDLQDLADLAAAHPGDSRQ
jgi:hypothetical protein